MRRCGCRVWEVGFCPLGGRKEETIKVRGTMVGGERGRQGKMPMTWARMRQSGFGQPCGVETEYGRGRG